MNELDHIYILKSDIKEAERLRDSGEHLAAVNYLIHSSKLLIKNVSSIKRGEING